MHHKPMNFGIFEKVWEENNIIYQAQQFVSNPKCKLVVHNKVVPIQHFIVEIQLAIYLKKSKEDKDRKWRI
jgi:hypothetical protein